MYYNFSQLKAIALYDFSRLSRFVRANSVKGYDIDSADKQKRRAAIYRDQYKNNDYITDLNGRHLESDGRMGLNKNEIKRHNSKLESRRAYTKETGSTDYGSPEYTKWVSANKAQQKADKTKQMNLNKDTQATRDKVNGLFEQKRRDARWDRIKEQLKSARRDSNLGAKLMGSYPPPSIIKSMKDPDFGKASILKSHNALKSHSAKFYTKNL